MALSVVVRKGFGISGSSRLGHLYESSWLGAGVGGILQHLAVGV